MHESENILNRQLDNEQKKKKQQKQIDQETQKRADFEIAKVEILKIKQRLQKLRQRRIQKEIIEIAKFISTFRDIDIFDSTLICDIQKFDLYSQVTDFLQHFERQQNQHQYRKSNVLVLLFKCFREFAFV